MVRNRLRAPEEVEVEEEKKTILRKRPLRKPSVSLAAYPSYALRTLGEPMAEGIPEKQNYGSLKDPLIPSLSVCFFRSPILVG